MKKVLIALFVLLLCSCEEDIVLVYKNRELDEVRHLEVPFSSISHFEYRGHSYIKFSSRVGHGAEAGVVHDPDCKCKEETK